MSGSSRRHDFELRIMPLRPSAYNLAMWLVADRADAEDVVQDAYVRAWRSFDSLRGERARAWLLTIVRNVAYSHLQNRNRMLNVIPIDEVLRHSDDGCGRALDLVSEEDDAEAQLIGAADRAALTAALAALPVALRETIVLREMEGLSYREIATMMETPIGTVMSRLSRARAELRKSLANQDKGKHSAV